MVCATDTILFAAWTEVFDVETKVFFTDTMVLIAEPKGFAKEEIFLTTNTAVIEAHKMVSGLDTTGFVADPTVPVSTTLVDVSNTMVGDADQIIDKTKVAASLDFYHGL